MGLTFYSYTCFMQMWGEKSELTCLVFPNMQNIWNENVFIIPLVDYTIQSYHTVYSAAIWMYIFVMFNEMLKVL